MKKPYCRSLTIGLMRTLLVAMRMEIGLICAVLMLAGCAHHKPSAGNAPPPPEKKNYTKTYITPDLGTVARVEMVNLEGRFVILSFPSGHVPPVGQHWRIRHGGLATARVTITGPQRDIDTVADIVEGEAKVGDEAVPE